MNFFNFYLYFCLAAGLGAVVRYLVISFMPRITNFFTGVFYVNIIGAFLMGVLSVNMNSNVWHIIIGTGFIGGLTTFSTMMTQGEQFNSFKRSMVYFALTLVLGIFLFIVAIHIHV